MKNYRPSFGTIFIGLFAVLLGTGALLSAFGFNVFFSPRLNFTWLVAGLLILCAVLLLTAALWPQRNKDAGASGNVGSVAKGSVSGSSVFSAAPAAFPSTPGRPSGPSRSGGAESVASASSARSASSAKSGADFGEGLGLGSSARNAAGSDFGSTDPGVANLFDSAPATESFATSQTQQFPTQPTQSFATQPTQEFNSAGFDAQAKEDK